MDLHRLLREDLSISHSLASLKNDPDAAFPVLVAKLKLTWRCNLRCKFCSLWGLGQTQDETSEPVSTHLASAFIRALHSQGLRKIHFSGGETLLRRDMDSLVLLARELGVQVNLTTNGTLIDKEKARFLVEHRVHTVAVSIDAATARKHDELRGVEGAWHSAWRGIERLQERKAAKGRGPTIAVNTVITRRNIDTLGRVHGLLVERGVDSWRLLPVRTQDRRLLPTAEQWMGLAGECDGWRPLLKSRTLDCSTSRSALLASRGQYSGQVFYGGHCFAPWFSLFVDANGEVLTCCTGRKQMPVYGNIAREPLNRILESRVRREVCTSMASGHPFDVCFSCNEFHDENDSLGNHDESEVIP